MKGKLHIIYRGGGSVCGRSFEDVYLKVPKGWSSLPLCAVLELAPKVCGSCIKFLNKMLNRPNDSNLAALEELTKDNLTKVTTVASTFKRVIRENRS